MQTQEERPHNKYRSEFKEGQVQGKDAPIQSKQPLDAKR